MLSEWIHDSLVVTSEPAQVWFQYDSYVTVDPLVTGSEAKAGYFTPINSNTANIQFSQKAPVGIRLIRLSMAPLSLDEYVSMMYFLVKGMPGKLVSSVRSEVMQKEPDPWS